MAKPKTVKPADEELEAFDSESEVEVEEQEEDGEGEEDFSDFEEATVSVDEKPAKVKKGKKAKEPKEPKAKSLGNPNRIADTVKFIANPNTDVPGGAFKTMHEILSRKPESFTLPEGIAYVIANGFKPAKGASGFEANKEQFVRGYLRFAIKNGWLVEEGVEV